MVSSDLLVPESPVVLDSYPSPEFREPAASTSRLRNATFPGEYAPTPLLADPTPFNILPRLESPLPVPEGNEPEGSQQLRSALILRHAIQWAVRHRDTDLISWLVSLEGRWADLLDEEVKVMEDEDGWGIVGMAVQATCGRQEEEEGVRVIVGRWGLNPGARGGRDRTGWTPLHLAALISTPLLVSFLLTRGASPNALTNRGLTPLDLIAGMQDRRDVAILLEHATSTGSSTSSLSVPDDAPSLSDRRRAMLHRRREHVAERARKLEEKEKNAKLDKERERWVREVVKMVEVDADLLLPAPKILKRRSADSGLGWMGDEEDELSDEVEDEREEDEGLADMCDDDSMLAYGPPQLPSIFDILITSYRPCCQPLPKRALPVNALFLYARFAHYRCDESWLEELIEGAVEKIEQGVYSNVEDLAFLSFWAYNTTLLLHLLRSDPGLGPACGELGLLGMVEELINAIHVFVIRVAERRIDTILDDALLNYEPLEDFDDVRFEGEWSLFRTFASKKQRGTILPKPSVVLAGVQTNGNEDGSSSPSGIFGSLREKMEANSPFKTPGRHQSLQDLRSTVTAAAGHSSAPDAAKASNGEVVLSGDTSTSPKTVADILSAVLLVLQLYEVNPAIVVQAFSQIFFWISCELFNRILTRKKYLCRTKAVQIRMNITALDDWVRSNGLPIQTATKHLEPVTQLLQWLQCQSALTQFDDLIGTLQNMRAINPLQMRRAVKDYRFEVNEGRMTDECAQYLVQLQKDWERRRVQMSVKAIQDEAKRKAVGSEGSELVAEDEMEDGTPIDALFDGTTSLSDFVPQSAPESLGELLDSRVMLPFVLPSDDVFLVATPPSDAAYFNAMAPNAWVSDSTCLSRPASRSSFASARPMGWALPDPRNLRRLPPDFFSWLKDAETTRRHKRESMRLLSEFHPATNPPLGPSLKINIPPRPSMDTLRVKPSLPALREDDITPIATSASYSSRRGAFPSSGLPGLQARSSLDQLREQAQVSFEPVKSPSHVRSDSYELRVRQAVNSLYSTTSDESENRPFSPTSPPGTKALPGSAGGVSFGVSTAPGTGHYELARHRRESEISNASSGGLKSPTSATSAASAEAGKKKWWRIMRRDGSTDSG